MKNTVLYSTRELILQFLEHLEIERNLSKLTIRNYAHYLNRYDNWLQLEVPKDQRDVRKLSIAQVRKYRLYLSRLSDDKGNTLSLVTQSYHVIALRSFLKFLAKNDFDVISAEKIDLPRAESKSLKFLRDEQVSRLMMAANGSSEADVRDRAMLEMLFSTGLRVSELVKLNREHVDFDSGEFGVIGKGGRARVVFMSTDAKHWLHRYFEMRLDDWKPAFIRYAKSKEAKLPGGEDMRLTTRSVQRTVEKYRKLAKLPVNITPHGLRHTFATDLLSHGAGLREVQEMLGHKNIATTQIYTHVTNPQLKKVHQKFHSGNKED